MCHTRAREAETHSQALFCRLKTDGQTVQRVAEACTWRITRRKFPPQMPCRSCSEEFAREANELGGIFETPRTTVSIKIRAYAHMLGTHHAHHVMQMLERIQYGGFAFLAEKTVIESDLRHSSLGSQRFHLLISEVAGM